MRYARYFVPGALAVALLAGCGPKVATPAATPSATATGIAALSTTEIFHQSLAALKKAGSYHMKGDVVVDRVDLIVDVKVQGSDAIATIAMGSKGSLGLLVVGGEKYIRGDEAFWKEAGVDAKNYSAHFKDKWVKARVNATDFEKFAGVFDAEQLFSTASAISLVKGDRASIAGVPALTLSDPADPYHISAVYVATEGEPYPLRLDGGVGGKLDFSDFGATFDEIKAPAAAEVFDPSK